MRLTCPNCDAEYEVDQAMIPPEGRDVQCSNCETTWFQADLSKAVQSSSNEDDEDFPDGIGTAAVAAARSVRNKPKLDPDALAVIKEEVALETEARKTDIEDIRKKMTAGGAETASANVQEMAAEELRALRRGKAFGLESAPVREDPSAKSGRLPDVEEINSALAASPDRVDDPEMDVASLDHGPARRARGFRLGFALTLLIAAVLLSLYVYAPQLSERFPDFGDQLTLYVGTVDHGRVWLDAMASGMIEQINDLIGRLTGEG